MLEKDIKILREKIDLLNYNLTKNRLMDFYEIFGSRKEVLFRNLFSGIWRGVGIGIGVTIITAVIIIVLQKLVTWNIPVIGEYIADIVDIVQNSR